MVARSEVITVRLMLDEAGLCLLCMMHVYCMVDWDWQCRCVKWPYTELN